MAILKGLAPELELREETHGWKAMRCPFHNDSSASASYNTSLQRFRCHACSIAGDGYDVIMKVERCDFQTARARAAELSGGKFADSSTCQNSSSQRSKLTSRRNSARSKLVRSQYRR